jgi:hypothetical protein
MVRRGDMMETIALLDRHGHQLQARTKILVEEGWPLAEWSKSVGGLRAQG